MRRRTATVLLTLLACLGSAATASASQFQESTFQDDPLLVYGTPEQQYSTLDQLVALGVDRIRVSVFWNLVAPDARSRTRPAGFDAKDHGAYPAGAWDRYDRLLRAAQVRGIAINFNITSPVPLWAAGDPGDRQDLAGVWTPDPQAFGEFVFAVGRRYSGEVPGVPRVDYWSIWNEPNQGAWLAPQFVSAGNGVFVEASPKLYRPLVDAAAAGLNNSGHGADTMLIGETAPKGNNQEGVSRAMAPRRFLLRLYCLDDNGQHLRGGAADAHGCPADNPADRMKAEHPGLFKISGWAHHPYELTRAPDRAPTSREFFTTGNLRSLTSLLRRVFLRHGAPLPPGSRSGFPLYLTEYGYQTDPPDPLGVSRGTQARFLNEAEWLTSRMSDVRTLAQFLMVDDKPVEAATAVERFGATFQSGLMTEQGKRKASYSAYRLPFHVRDASVRRGRRISLWGFVRPGRNGQAQRATIEFRAGKKGRFRTLRRVRTEPRRGYFAARMTLRRSGAVRFRWTDPRRNRTFRSRAIAVRAR